MSRCKYCQEPVSWLQRANGSWYPPFEYDDQLETMEYVVEWKDGNWTATPTNQDLQVKVQPHACLQRAVAADEHRTGLQLLAEPAPRVEIQFRERTVRVQPTHDALIKVAKQLRRKCTKCNAEAFVWCSKVAEPDVETKQLHWER